MARSRWGMSSAVANSNWFFRSCWAFRCDKRRFHCSRSNSWSSALGTKTPQTPNLSLFIHFHAGTPASESIKLWHRTTPLFEVLQLPLILSQMGQGLLRLCRVNRLMLFSPRDAEALTLKDACLLVVANPRLRVAVTICVTLVRWRFQSMALAIVLSVTIVSQWL